MHIGYELAIYHLTSNKHEWNNCFIKMPTKYQEFFPTLFVKTTDFQLVFNRAWYNGSYTMMAKPIRALELHYPMTQFLMIYNIHTTVSPLTEASIRRTPQFVLTFSNPFNRLCIRQASLLDGQLVLVPKGTS